MTDYPNPKEALFGNGHIANLYCAIKYVTWQFVHAVFFTIILFIFYPLDTIAEKIAPHTPTIPRRIFAPFYPIWNGFGWLIQTRPVKYTGYAIIAPFAGAVLLLASPMFLFEKIKATRYGKYVGSQVKETPGVRRLYNECPVSMDMEPKWFDRYLRKLDT